MGQSKDDHCILPPLLPLLTKAIVYFFSWKSLMWRCSRKHTTKLLAPVSCQG